MIIQIEDNLAFAQEFPTDWADVLGEERLEAIEKVLRSAARANLNHSWMVAETGALRWNMNLRPEVMLDATGRLR